MPVIWKTRRDGVRQRFNISPNRKKATYLYKSGISSRGVGKMLGISHARVLKILKSEGIERRSITKPILNPDYKKLNKSRAYILGVMCGDGCIFSGIEHKGKWKFKSYIVHLSVKDRDFIDEFIKHTKIVYGVEPRIYFRKREKKHWSDIWVARFRRKTIYEDLARYEFGGNSWVVPEEIIKCKNDEIIGSFLRGFYDSEGSFVIGKRGASLTACSTNNLGIIQIKRLIEKLGINTLKIYQNDKGYTDKCFYLCITHRDNYKIYLNKVGFSIKRKENKIKEYLGRLNESKKSACPSGSDIQLVKAG